jgi:hypothetical protein
LLEYPFGLLGQTLLVAALLALYLLPPGFATAWLSDLAGFRQRSVAEKLAWSLALSFPVSTMISVGLGHLAGEPVVQAVFAVFLISALAISVRHALHKAGNVRAARSFRLLLPLLVACSLCLVASLPVMVHGHLQEGLLTNDWYIRLPLLYSAVRGGVPPINPLFTLAGHSPALHYYYFFYALCAEPLKLLHDALGNDGPRAALIASTLWACAMFFSVAWLMLKYLVLREDSELGQSQRHMLVFVFVSLIAGLDLLPNLIALLLGGRLFPTLFWWGESITPWPGTLPFAPHHYVGLSMAMLGYLLLSRSYFRMSQRWIASAIAAICFAAAIGTSTFVAAAVMAAAGIFALSEALRHRWNDAAAMTAALAGALAIDWFYIVPTFLRHDPGSAASSHTLPLKLVLLHWHEAYGLTGELLTRFLHIPQPHGLIAYVFSLPMLLALFAIQWGFFWIMLTRQARHELAQRRTMPQEQRALWCLFGTCAVLTTFISSAPLQHGINDFGRHTLLAATFVLMLWACPLVLSAWQQHRAGAKILNRWRFLAVLLCLLGFAGTAWDIAAQRFYLPLVDAGTVRPRDPFSYRPGSSMRYAELKDAWDAIGEKTASDGVVQGNPDGPLQRPLLLYLNRRVAAGDISCEASFGGDETVCRNEIVRPLLGIYLQPEAQPLYKTVFDASPAAFETTCRHIRLAALVATDYDPVWADANSWVWHEPALFAGHFVRVLACPQ